MPFSHSINRVSKTLELIYKDVWGPSPIFSINRFKYYVFFLDAFTRYTWLFPIYRKSDVYATFKQFQLHVERLFDCKIKIVQSDWGGEYHSLQKFLQSLGIHHRLSCSHTRQQNSAIERKHRHIVETGLALLSHAHIPLKHWDDAFLTACYLINRLPTPLFNHTTPYKALFHSPPNYSLLKVFGCACWPNLRPYNSNKLQPCSFRCVFLGYSPIHKGYKCLHISLGRVYIPRDVVFEDKIFSFNIGPPPTVPATTSLHGLPLLTVPIISPSPQPNPNSPPQNPQNPPSSPNSIDTIALPNPFSSPPFLPISSHQMVTRSKAHITKPKVFHDGTVRYPLPHALLTESGQSPMEPTCYTISMKDPQWRAAMNSEFDALLKNRTWQLVSPHNARNIIGCK